MKLFWKKKISSDKDKQIEMIAAAKRLYQHQILAATDGNLSARETGETILITPSGKQKAFLTPGDFVLFNSQNKTKKGKASSEVSMHLKVYELCPKANFVIHAHPPSAIAWSIAFPKLKFMPNDILPELILAAGNIPFIPYARPGTEQMAFNIAPYLPHHRAMVLSRHGALSWGESIDEAINGIERIEHTAQILLKAKTLRGLTTLPQDEIDYLQQKRKKIGEINL
jgi:L-fuculose-phosphate aldolase